jgi:hypothetical protein
VTKSILFIFGTLFLYLLTSCSWTKSISGKYRSNFAVHGFFVTRINLNNDSTFGYRMSGDLMSDTSNGRYKFDHNYVILYHEPFRHDTSEYEKYGKEAVLLSHALSTNNHLKSPGRYLIGHNKLFVCDSNGTVIKKQFGYSKWRQYLLFGKHWYKRRYYLMRVD